MYNSITPNYLDQIRQERGFDGLKSYFKSLSETRSEYVINLINDEQLRYCSLFTLKQDINKMGLNSYLSVRNSYALEITDIILSRNLERSDNTQLDLYQVPVDTLKWMLLTGFNEDGISAQYDEVLDFTAILLIKVHKDYTILPVITEMIFTRNRLGRFTHHLIWALFESGNPDCLLYIAKYILSDYPQDIELARKLLHFLPFMNQQGTVNKEMQYASFQKWFQENKPFLQYTGECMQMTGTPVPFKVINKGVYGND